MSLLAGLDFAPLAPFTTPIVDGLVIADLRRADPNDVQVLGRTIEAASNRLEQAKVAGAEYLDRHGVLDVLLAVRRSRPDEAYAADFADLARLYRLVRERKPETVLEFGSGWSTFALAQALHDNGHGHLVSIEADQQWADANRAALPDHLVERVELRHCRAVLGTWGHTPVFFHEGCPELKPDLVYLDGPSLYPTVRAAGDVLALEASLQPGTVVAVDGRHDNVILLADRLRRSWRVQAQGLRCVSENHELSDLVIHASVFELLQ